MENFERILTEHPTTSGIILIIIAVLLIILFFEGDFFKRDKGYENITGEMNAGYWSVVLILIIIGLSLLFGNP